MLPQNKRDKVCEGTITNVFLDLDNRPAIRILPGIPRKKLLEIGQWRKALLPCRELARRRLWVGNTLCGRCGSYDVSRPWP
jgi:branched-subunit amino acid aminotransferase/4-amino-4-deoxychorismate lyase